jgi:hypothetical protein
MRLHLARPPTPSLLAARNLAPKPYRWQAKGADILAKLQRARKSLEKVTSRTSETGR